MIDRVHRELTDDDIRRVAEDDGEPFEEKMAKVTAALHGQTEQSAKLDRIIWANLEDIGYGR